MIRKAYVDTPAGQIHYRHLPAAGTPILFFHRTPICSSSFDRVFAALAGWRPLYAFDTPGFGESFVPAPPFTVGDYRDSILAAIDALGLRDFHLCGNHSGAHFAIAIAAHSHTRARSLMIDGVMYHTADERAVRRAARRSAPEIDAAGNYIQQAWSYLQPYYPRFVADTIHQEFIGAMRTMQTRDTCHTALLDQDVPAVLRRVTCPIHAFAASDDVYVSLLPRIAADLPNATISTYGDAGIAGPELRPLEFADTVRRTVRAAEA